MADKKTLTISCHCGQHKHSFTVPTSSLPIKHRLCHCNISRRISGCLFTSYFPIPTPPPALTGLTAYSSSPILDRLFCATCSTHLYCRYNDDGHFEASHGSVQGDTSDLFTFEEHGWIEDTKDGGASSWLTSIDGKPLNRYMVEWSKSPSAPLDWHSPDSTAALGRQPTADAKLPVRCHCTGVSFSIARPSDAALLASSPLPDLLVPYNSGAETANPDNKPWWLSTDRSKYLAGNCACASCRKVAGFDIVPWTFIPIACLSLADGSPFKLPFGTMKAYESSSNEDGKKRVRWFCRRCGANVLWTGEERPTLVDVSVGLLDAPSGARAEEWVQWDMADRVSFKEDAHHAGLADALEKGLVEWYGKN